MAPIEISSALVLNGRAHTGTICKVRHLLLPHEQQWSTVTLGQVRLPLAPFPPPLNFRQRHRLCGIAETTGALAKAALSAAAMQTSSSTAPVCYPVLGWSPLRTTSVGSSRQFHKSVRRGHMVSTS